MKLGDLTVEWVNSFKYLGLTFISGSSIKVDCQVIKRKCYAACNSVLTHSRRNNELVKLQLSKSFCLPLLTYCLGAIEVPRHKIKKMGVCYNDCFRKIFGFHRWESVKELQGYLGELPFELMYDLYRWKFLTKKTGLARSNRRLMDFSNLQYSHTSKLSKLYGEDICTISGMSAGIETFFEFN
jgi:hypothetical protein